MKSTRRRLALLVLASVSLSIFGLTPGFAAATVGSFEIDGNTADDSGPGEPIDWATPPPNLVTFTDGTGQTDDSFGSGSKENIPNEWDFVTSSVPGKTDILSGAVAFRRLPPDPTGDTFVYLNFTRSANTGDTFANFELNKSRQTYVNSEGDAVPVRTAGDTLIAFFVTTGGQTLAIELRSWIGDQYSGVWGPPITGTQGVDWDAAVNADDHGRWTFAEAAINFDAFGIEPSCPGTGAAWIKTTTSAAFETAALADRTDRKDLNLSNCSVKNWSFTFDPSPIDGAKVFAVYTVQPAENREVELTDPDADGTYTATDNQIPPGVVTYRFEVRTAAGDVIWTGPQGTETFLPETTITNVGSLHYDMTLTPESAENFDDDPHVFTARVFEVGTDVPLPNVTVNFALFGGTPSGCGSISPSNGVTDATGTVTTTLTSTGPCTTSIRAWINGAGGTSGFDSGEAGDVSTKTFVRYALSVTPPSANNEVGRPHTFTVTLTRDTGAGPAGYGGQTLALTLSPGVSDAHFTEINGSPASGTAGTCTTDTGGVCTATIIATTPGDVTLTATYLATDSGGQTRTVTASGTKSYRTFALTATPGEATNEVGDPHTFTITLTQDGGSGPIGIEGETVELTLDPGASNASFTAIVVGTIIDATHATCTTNAAGQCLATITASTPGAVTLTASWENEEIVVGGASASTTAAKQYLAFALTATPAQATNEVGDPHTFTITLTQDDGTGPAGLPGETLTLALNPGTSDAEFTDINGSPASGITGTCSTDSNGQCTATILASTPGAVTLTVTWVNETIVVGGATRTATAAKQYVDFDLVVTPATAYNLVGEPHTFTITLTRDEGTGPVGLPGETLMLTLDPGATDAEFTEINGVPASGTTGECITDAGGQCTATILSSQPGAVTLTVTWENETIVVGGATRTASAAKIYLRINVSKTSCPTEQVVRGGILTYTVNFSLEGGTVTGATFVDDLPPEVEFISADPIAGVDPTVSGGTVTWNFGSLAPGVYSGTITVRVRPGAPLNQPIRNTVTLDADRFAPQIAHHDVVVGNAGTTADGRAFGISANILDGLVEIPPTPDSDVTNPDQVLSIANPLNPAAPLVGVLDVIETDESTDDEAAYSAMARVVDLNLVIPDVVTVEADSIVARSSSFANGTTAGSTHSGSVIQNLRINGTRYGDISEPTTITVTLDGGVVAEVSVLERIASGAAAGIPQPGALFDSGLVVNGIHLVVRDREPIPMDESTDVIVAHAETSAAFPSGLSCGASTPSVSGRAVALETANVDPDVPSVEVAEVILPITGGSLSATLADVDLPDLGTSDSVHTSTEGEIADGPDVDTDAVEATSVAEVEGLDLLDGTITATVVKSTSSSTLAGSTGDAVIVDLDVAGIPVCVQCDPAPNTVFLGIPAAVILLNEQIESPGGLTVNAVHIYIVGKGNPLGLPAGAEIIISSAHSDAHPPAASAGASRAGSPAQAENSGVAPVVPGVAPAPQPAKPAPLPAKPAPAPAPIKKPRLPGGVI